MLSFVCGPLKQKIALKKIKLGWKSLLEIFFIGVVFAIKKQHQWIELNGENLFIYFFVRITSFTQENNFFLFLLNINFGGITFLGKVSAEKEGYHWT